VTWQRTLVPLTQTRHDTTQQYLSTLLSLSLSPVWPSTQTRSEHPQWMWITVLRVRHFSFSLCLAPPLSSLSVASPFHRAEVTEPTFVFGIIFSLFLCYVASPSSFIFLVSVHNPISHSHMMLSFFHIFSFLDSQSSPSFTLLSFSFYVQENHLFLASRHVDNTTK
jgi:hypothetical protein